MRLISGVVHSEWEAWKLAATMHPKKNWGGVKLSRREKMGRERGRGGKNLDGKKGGGKQEDVVRIKVAPPLPLSYSGFPPPQKKTGFTTDTDTFFCFQLDNANLIDEIFLQKIQSHSNNTYFLRVLKKKGEERNRVSLLINKKYQSWRRRKRRRRITLSAALRTVLRTPLQKLGGWGGNKEAKWVKSGKSGVVNWWGWWGGEEPGCGFIPSSDRTARLPTEM